MVFEERRGNPAYQLKISRSKEWTNNKLNPQRAPGARFSKAPETFRARNIIAKSRTLRLQSCFIHIFERWREVPFIQEVSGVYTSSVLDTDDLKMALRARKLSGAFEKQAPGPGIEPGHIGRKRALSPRALRHPCSPNARSFCLECKQKE